MLACAAPQRMMWVLVCALALSCFVGNVRRSESGYPKLVWHGPVLLDFTVQAERACVAGVVKSNLQGTPSDVMVVVPEYRPEMLYLIGRTLSGRVLYTVRKTDVGQLADTEGAVIPQ
jgi:hypothetical protein